MTIPEEVRPIHRLVAALPMPAKGKIIEGVRLYAHALPDDRVRYRADGNTVRTFAPSEWRYLYIQTLQDGRAMWIHYRSGAAWLYRGWGQVDSDLFGPTQIRVSDELRFARPIFSRYSVDARQQIAAE